ncbi:MAG TPA: dihydrolipoamide acetyltransferase family protein [Acidimicrobiales bacterium]|nr:dihydrolipoamide acetyltransferase family protein [Acidimicrobiales bacterium]
MADITMPQLGETVTEGTITRWFKEVGDQVEEDEVLFEVSTDKVDSEVPSSAAGTLTEILVQEGDTVDVGTRLAVISDGDGGGGESAAAGAAGSGDAPAEDGGADDEAPTDDAAVAPAAEAAEKTEGEDDAPSATSTAGEQAPASDAATGEPDGSAAGRLLSPVVRRLVAEHGLDPSSIEGTGAGGRITRNDVLAVVEREGGGAAEPKRAAPSATPAPAATEPGAGPRRAEPMPLATAGERDEVVPLSNIRRRTGEHLVRSLATSAHTLVAIEVDYDNLDKVRQPARASFKDEEGISLTYLPFITRALVDAIREFPHVNSSVGDGELIVHHDVNVGIAVDMDFEGLMVPVVRGADGKRLRALAREIAELAARTRDKRLGPDDIAGGTFTITNPGPFGTFVTYPIINQPQVAILSTDGVKKRPVVVEAADGSDAIGIHPTGTLALSFDHRAFDGAYAAAFLAKVKEILETRDWAAELT